MPGFLQKFFFNGTRSITIQVSTVMSQSIPTGCTPGQPPGISSKKLPGGSGSDF